MNQEESNRLVGLEVLVRERSKIVDHRLDRFDQRFDRVDEQLILVAQLIKTTNGHNPTVEKSAWGAAAASLMVAVGAIGKAAGWW